VATLELPALVVDTVAAVTAAQRPALINRDPGPDEVAVPIDATVALELVDAGPDGIDRAATRVWVDGVLAFDGGAVPELQPGFDGPAAEVIEGADTLRVVLHPATFFASEALVLGESELGVDWILGPSNRFARYAFDVVVGVPLTDAQRKQLRAIVEYLKPAHTHFVTLVEPAPPAFIDHWELGVSEVGVTTDLH
jgi:hypothetical protein